MQILVADDGVGIFGKIQRALRLSNPADVVLELRKGKFTTDPSSHTGEGIFFTSRLCDSFSIASQPIVWRAGSDRQDRVMEDADKEQRGTAVWMETMTSTDRTLDEVFALYSEDYQFDRTHVPVLVATMGSDEYLVSRSAARRVVSRLERFREVVLDFEGVATIGQAFADEIFRVFATSNPDLRLLPVHMTPQVSRLIDRANANRSASESSA